MPKFLFRCAKDDTRTAGRRTAGAAVVLVLALTLAACGGSAPGQGATAEKPVVLTTFTVLADVALTDDIRRQLTDLDRRGCLG